MSKGQEWPSAIVFSTAMVLKKGNPFGDDETNPAGNDVVLKGTCCKL